MNGRSAVLLAFLAAACGPATPPGPEEEPLPNPGDTLVTQWTEPPLASPVGNRWLVVAADWDQALLTDFAGDTLLPLGGPGQQAYLHPFQVFAFRDSVYLADWGKRRTTVWSPEGRLVDSIPFADALRGAYVRARDGAGQLYFQVDPQPRRDGSGNLDSAAIVRAPRSLTRFDTVARLAPLELARVEPDERLRFAPGTVAPPHARAKDRLGALRRTKPEAKLAHAQFDLANEYGFSSWRALKEEVDLRQDEQVDDQDDVAGGEAGEAEAAPEEEGQPRPAPRLQQEDGAQERSEGGGEVDSGGDHVFLRRRKAAGKPRTLALGLEWMRFVTGTRWRA